MVIIACIVSDRNITAFRNNLYVFKLKKNIPAVVPNAP